MSPNANQSIQKHVQEAVMQNAPSISNNPQKLPSKVQLGMNTVPVLDQGMHGSCATFASTAAVDAVLGEVDPYMGHGDYISQLCLLTLGQYIENNSYGASGWEGQMPEKILDRMQEFGIISQKNQQTQGCAGLTDYPRDDFTIPQNQMTLQDYREQSEQLDDEAYYTWSSLLSTYQFLFHEKDMMALQTEVKTALNEGDRLVIGFFLPLIEGVGALGHFHEANDAWVVTPHLLKIIGAPLFYLNGWAGHAIIITGYDDDAVAVDKEGREHKGLFTLRNSWGPEAGDKGDYYMSYDYFRALTMDVIRIRTLVP